jgi:DNA-binding NarL/FixJ family response regulator
VIRVLIVEDVELVRDSFTLLVNSSPGCTAVGEAATGVEGVRLAGELRPDVVLMDVRMPELDGIEATRLISRNPDLADVRVLILTTFDHDEYVYGALRAGASGFLLKDARPEELLAGIRAVAVGDAVIAPALTRRLLDEFAQYVPSHRTEPSEDPRLTSLTDREREILVAVGKGWTNGEIATRFVLSESTVKTHVGRVLAKIGARDRIQAVIFAYDHGLARPTVD